MLLTAHCGLSSLAQDAATASRFADIGFRDQYVYHLPQIKEGTRTQPCHFQRLASQRIVGDGAPFKMDIYNCEGGDGWSLEVVTEDGAPIVRDDLFEDDRAAFQEAIRTIRSEGAVAFSNGGAGPQTLALDRAFHVVDVVNHVGHSAELTNSTTWQVKRRPVQLPTRKLDRNHSTPD